MGFDVYSNRRSGGDFYSLASGHHMIAYDSKGYLATPSGDGGDTAVREGLMAIFGKPNKILDLVTNGECVRNPWQQPWNNPKNFTRDQLKLLVAGLFSIGRHDICEEILQHHERRNYWCQNTERDWPGSIKISRPHAFYKDSQPDARTTLMKFNWWKFRFHPDPEKIDLTKEIETRLFDHCDPLAPQDVHFLELAAKRKYHKNKLGPWFHDRALSNHISGSGKEQNQMFGECLVFGTLQKFKTTIKLNERGAFYWGDRGEIEYHNMMMEFLNDYPGGVVKKA